MTLSIKKYEIITDRNTGEVKVLKYTITLSYKESDMNKNLTNKESTDLLQSCGLKLPGYYKDKGLKELEDALQKSQAISSVYKDKIKNVANYNYVAGKSIANPKNKNPSAKTRNDIS